MSDPVTKRPAIILDRDGVINQDSKHYIKSVAEFHLYPRSIEAIKRLYQVGWPIFVITNQSGIGRGYYSEQTLADMHEVLLKQVREHDGDIQAIYFCPHHPDDNCNCRKPKTGLFEQLANEHDIDLNESYYIGDKASDVQAGLNASCTPVLVRTGQGLENVDAEIVSDNQVMIFADLLAFVESFIATENSDAS